MITQAQFLLLTGRSDLEDLSSSDFGLVCSIVEQRLMAALCLEEAPNDVLWDQLLADALSVSVDVKNDRGLQSESMRNYSYQLRDYANSWGMLSEKSGDLLNMFNACPSGVTMQQDRAARIYGGRHGRV